MEDKNEILIKKYQFILEELKNIGDIYNGRGYFPDTDMPFFEERGCEVTNYDFGIEEFEVKKVSDGPIKNKTIKREKSHS